MNHEYAPTKPTKTSPECWFPNNKYCTLAKLMKLKSFSLSKQAQELHKLAAFY